VLGSPSSWHGRLVRSYLPEIMLGFQKIGITGYLLSVLSLRGVHKL
jgi:hypothetical protein